MAQSGEVSGGSRFRSSERLEVIETYQKLRAAEAKASWARRQSREFAQQSLFVPAGGC